MSRTNFHNVWNGMTKRCRLKSRSDWHRYGGRGIKTCDRWQEFLRFKEDMYDSYNKHKKNNKTTLLDRIDNDDGYYKENCRWVTAKESCENRITTHWIMCHGEKKTLSDWARSLGITPTTLSDRLKAGWSIEDAVTKTAIYSKYNKKSKSDLGVNYNKKV